MKYKNLLFYLSECRNYSFNQHKFGYVIKMTTEIYKLHFDQQNGLTQINSTLNELADNEVRIQVLFTGINKNDLLYLDGKHRNDYFGVQVVGKVVAAGKIVGKCKVSDIVGVYHGNTNYGEFKTGFSSYLQVNQSQIVYIPNSIAPENAAGLIGAGVTAFNALQKVPFGDSIAVVGTGILAYFTTQYAKKVFNFKVTLFGYDVNAQLAQNFGADSFEILSLQNIKKNDEKYHHIILTDVIGEAEAVFIQNIAWRTGRVIVAIDMGYYPQIKVFDLVCSQREFVGVKRGSYGQIVRALQAAVFHEIKAKVEALNFVDYAVAFKRAREVNWISVVLKY